MSYDKNTQLHAILDIICPNHLRTCSILYNQLDYYFTKLIYIPPRTLLKAKTQNRHVAVLELCQNLLKPVPKFSIHNDCN